MSISFKTPLTPLVPLLIAASSSCLWVGEFRVIASGFHGPRQ